MPPPGWRRSVDEVAAPYENFLVPVPVSGADVCAVCHSVVEGWPECFKCHEGLAILGSGAADAVVFVSLAPNDEQMGTELFTYKNPRTPARLRAQKSAGLAAVLWTWLNRHEPCLAHLLGIETFDLITTVPSTSGRDPHPLVDVVSGLVENTGQPTRRPARGQPHGRRPSALRT